ncbi:MAG: IclR family transcriptional regulator [Spirochaetia bacterium]
MKVQSIDRVFDILELLSIKHEGLSLTEISRRLELPTSTVFRLLSVLRSRNYIEKNDSTNVYRLGLGFVELTSLYLSNIELKTEAQPYLRNLSQMTGQVVFMGTEHDGELVYIDKYEQFNEIRKYCFLGQRRPLYCTALGKALLTGFKDEEIRELYPEGELKPMTSHTITNVERLIEEVHEICLRGYAIDDQEIEEAMWCVAAPVYDYRGIIIAAVSTSWDLGSHKDADRDKNIELVRKTALNISIRMGFRPERQAITCVHEH